MAKKKRKKTQKKKAAAPSSTLEKEVIQPSSSPSLEPETPPERPTKKKPKKKYVLYLVPIILVAAAVVIYLSTLKRESPYQIIKDNDLNMLLITLDTTRADRIGCYGYERAETPNLDGLAAGGVRFANAYCQVPLTLPSHCSILTGTYPLYHRVHNNGFYYLNPDFTTLAEVLKAEGFSTAAFVASFTVDSRFGVDQGFDVFNDDFLERGVSKNFTSERKAGEVFTDFAEWLDENHSKKFFSWIHFYDPHVPYNPPSPFKETYADRPYDGEIAYMDQYVGKIVEKLKEHNLLESTLIIAAGDHGEALGEKNEVDHGLYIYDITMRVPFIIYAPNHLPQGLTIDGKVRLIDIMPTVCDMLGLPIHEDVQGTTLLPYASGRKSEDLPSYIETYMPREYYGWSELLGLIEGDWKYIKAPKPELYNLKTDPSEENNLYYEQERVASDLKGKLEDMREKLSSTGDASKKTLSREEQERLRSLGYIAGEFEGNTAKQDLPDPKDKVEVYAIFAHARRYEYEQDYERAERNYRELLELNPETPWNYVYLALLYEKMDRLDDSVQVLEQGRDRLPDSIVILSRLALFYMKKARVEEAYQTSQVVLRIDPKYFDALYMSGVALVNMGRWEEALEYVERALAIEPENKPLRIQYAYCLFALNRGEDALEVYQQLKVEFPEDPVIYREIGILYDSMGDLEKARENLSKAVELSPSPNTYFNYAVVLEKSGQLDEAIRYLKLYLETTREGNTDRKNQAAQALAQWEAKLRRQ